MLWGEGNCGFGVIRWADDRASGLTDILLQIETTIVFLGWRKQEHTSARVAGCQGRSGDPMEALQSVPRYKDTHTSLDHFQLPLSLEGDFERDDLLPVGSCSWL